jgi:hypothetical protein
VPGLQYYAFDREVERKRDMEREKEKNLKDENMFAEVPKNIVKEKVNEHLMSGAIQVTEREVGSDERADPRSTSIGREFLPKRWLAGSRKGKARAKNSVG